MTNYMKENIMSKLEKEICQYMLQRGIFDAMIKYKKDYQQLGVIFKRLHGQYFTHYCKSREIAVPKTKFNWKKKLELISETFEQKVINYSDTNRTKHKITIQCLKCGKIYSKTWDQYMSGAVCSCTKTFQRKVVDIDYYIGHYIKQGWIVTNPEDFVNSHSILKLAHICGKERTGWAKTFRTQKGHCDCQTKKVRETKAKPKVKVAKPKVEKVKPPTIYQRLQAKGLTRSQVKHILKQARRHGYTVVDVTENEIIRKHKCGRIHTFNRDSTINYNPICPCEAEQLFFDALSKYPLQKPFKERWELIQYRGKTKPVVIKCKKCGYIKTLKNMHKFTYHVLCGCEDRISYGERMIFNLLHHNNIPFERQYTLNEKRFDFYLPEQGILLEYDGIQHTIDVPHWSITHEAQKANDELKDNIAKEHSFVLIRFAHDSSEYDIINKLKSYIHINKKEGFDYNAPVKLLPDFILDDYITMTYEQIKEKYKHKGYSLSLVRLNKEFKMKYGNTKTGLGLNKLPDIVLEDFKNMDVHELREKYPDIAHLINNTKLRTEFRAKYGISKLEYRAQPLPDCILTDFATMSLAKIFDKYKDSGHIITNHKLNKQFAAKYGMAKSEYQKQLQNSDEK